jgi:hypothetical protein
MPNLQWLGQCEQPPSSAAACELVEGNLSALPKVLVTTILRAGLIGVGMYALGERQHLARNALAGAMATEMFLLGWAYVKKRPV